MDNNVIISAWLNVPKAAEKLKKYAPKGSRREFIQFAPERGEISANNGPQLQFLPVEFYDVERGEMYVNSLCAVGTCSPKDIKAIAGRRVHMVVKAGKRTKTTWQNCRTVEVVEYFNATTFYGDNGKILCSHSTRPGYVIPPAEKVYSAAELTTCARIAVDKKAAKTLAGLLKICVLDNVDGGQFAAVAVEFAAGECVALVRSYLFGDNAQAGFTIEEHRLKLSAPACGSGLYYVQAQFLIDALKNDLILYFATLRGKECKVITKSLNGFLISMGCNSEAEKQQLPAARAEAVESMQAESRPEVDNAQVAPEALQAAAPAVVVDNQPEPPAVDNTPPESTSPAKDTPPKATQAATVQSVEDAPAARAEAPAEVTPAVPKFFTFHRIPPRRPGLTFAADRRAVVDYDKPP